MNREIEFRGKRLDNGEWICGDLMHDNHGGCYIYPLDSLGLFAENKVANDTIGQFTGLVDKKGVKIYEGDIVKHPYIDPIFRDLVEPKDGDGVTSEVVFHDGAFCVKYDINDFIYLDSFTRHGYVEVIGNIHDNPELLSTK